MSIRPTQRPILLSVLLSVLFVALMLSAVIVHRGPAALFDWPDVWWVYALCVIQSTTIWIGLGPLRARRRTELQQRGNG